MILSKIQEIYQIPNPYDNIIGLADKIKFIYSSEITLLFYEIEQFDIFTFFQKMLNHNEIASATLINIDGKSILIIETEITAKEIDFYNSYLHSSAVLNEGRYVYPTLCYYMNFKSCTTICKVMLKFKNAFGIILSFDIVKNMAKVACLIEKDIPKARIIYENVRYNDDLYYGAFVIIKVTLSCLKFNDLEISENEKNDIIIAYKHVDEFDELMSQMNFQIYSGDYKNAIITFKNICTKHKIMAKLCIDDVIEIGEILSDKSSFSKIDIDKIISPLL